MVAAVAESSLVAGGCSPCIDEAGKVGSERFVGGVSMMLAGMNRLSSIG